VSFTLFTPDRHSIGNSLSILPETFPIRGRSKNGESNVCQQITYLVGQDFRADHICRAGVLLVCGEDDLDVPAVCCLGKRNIQLSVRKNRDSKINLDAFTPRFMRDVLREDFSRITANGDSASLRHRSCRQENS